MRPRFGAPGSRLVRRLPSALLLPSGNSYGINFIAQAIAGRPEQQSFDQSLKVNSITNTAPLPILYGQRLIGGAEQRFITGEDNRYLWRVMALCEGEIEGAQQVYLNDNDVDTYVALQAIRSD